MTQPQQPEIGENTNERMADRPPPVEPDLATSTGAIDDTAPASSGVPTLDDVG